MFQQGRIVSCRGCGGTGQRKPALPTDFPKDCSTCGGTGRVRLNPGDSWCGHCQGTGYEKAGIPGFQTMRTCHICGGSGIVQV